MVASNVRPAGLKVSPLSTEAKEYSKHLEQPKFQPPVTIDGVEVQFLMALRDACASIAQGEFEFACCKFAGDMLDMMKRLFKERREAEFRQVAQEMETLRKEKELAQEKLRRATELGLDTTTLEAQVKSLGYKLSLAHDAVGAVWQKIHDLDSTYARVMPQMDEQILKFMRFNAAKDHDKEMTSRQHACVKFRQQEMVGSIKASRQQALVEVDKANTRADQLGAQLTQVTADHEAKLAQVATERDQARAEMDQERAEKEGLAAQLAKVTAEKEAQAANLGSQLEAANEVSETYYEKLGAANAKISELVMWNHQLVVDKTEMLLRLRQASQAQASPDEPNLAHLAHLAPVKTIGANTGGSSDGGSSDGCSNGSSDGGSSVGSSDAGSSTGGGIISRGGSFSSQLSLELPPTPDINRATAAAAAAGAVAAAAGGVKGGLGSPTAAFRCWDASSSDGYSSSNSSEGGDGSGSEGGGSEGCASPTPSLSCYLTETGSEELGSESEGQQQQQQQQQQGGDAVVIQIQPAAAAQEVVVVVATEAAPAAAAAEGGDGAYNDSSGWFSGWGSSISSWFTASSWAGSEGGNNGSSSSSSELSMEDFTLLMVP